MKYVVILLTAAAFLYSSLDTTYEVEHRQHVVSAGQTVWEIAVQYFPDQNKAKHIGEFAYDISKLNNLKGKFIQPGDTLIIPLAKEM